MRRGRRSFLKAAGMTGLSTVLVNRLTGVALGQKRTNPNSGTGLGSQIAKAVPVDNLAQITRSMFNANLNTKFSFSQGGVYLTDLTLIRIDTLNPPNVKGDPTDLRECFSLCFRATVRLPLRQNTYQVTHKSLGSFQLFIVPGTATDKAGLHYEAIINRVIA